LNEEEIMQVFVWEGLAGKYQVIVCARDVDEAREKALEVVDRDTFSSTDRRRLRRDIQQCYPDYNESPGIVIERE
jgi:hypothetical protein